MGNGKVQCAPRINRWGPNFSLAVTYPSYPSTLKRIEQDVAPRDMLPLPPRFHAWIYSKSWFGLAGGR